MKSPASREAGREGAVSGREFQRSRSHSQSPQRRHLADQSRSSLQQSHHERSRSPAPLWDNGRGNLRDRSPGRQREARSKSPSRTDDRAARSAAGSKGNGFKWKAKSNAVDDGAANDLKRSSGKPGPMERGYNHGPAKGQSDSNDDVRNKFGDNYEARYNRGATSTTNAKNDAVPGMEDGQIDASEKKQRKKLKREREKEKEKKAGPRPTSEPMIIVHVNDRLGTKAAIPCLASDPVRLFKAQVAARIGRDPHEIMLKRQGERPFKDQLTLEDYGVSNGVQLDLEMDTGD